MSRRTLTRVALAVAAALALTSAAALTTLTPALSATDPVKIMPLGDSITAGPGCWRALLWDQLQSGGYTDIDFVGSQSSGGCTVDFDTDHEGHSGMSATGLASQNLLPDWLAATTPDIVLMHLGTNDMWGNWIPTSDIIAAYTTLVEQMRASNPSMKIVVAQLIPMDPSSCPECAEQVVALNAAIPDWVEATSTTQSPITIVDQWTGFDVVEDTGDGVHPNESGFQKMADRWYPAVTEALGGAAASPTSPAASQSSPASSASATASTSTSTSASASASESNSGSNSASPTTTTSSTPSESCSATYTVVSQWSDGLQGQVTVTNQVPATTTQAWYVTITFAGDEQITQAWNATVTQSGNVATAGNLSWNGVLASGESASFGFLASASAAATTAPAVTCLVAATS